jgi:hypothetical protein
VFELPDTRIEPANMQNSPLIAELKRRKAHSDDPVYPLILKELAVLYATIEKLSRLSMSLEKEAEAKEQFNSEC